MSTLIKIGIKDRSGKYKDYMISVSDELDRFGNNVAMYVEQTKEERDAKVKRTYVGNGRVVWTDGKIETAPNPNAPKEAGIDIGESAPKTESVLPELKEDNIAESTTPIVDATDDLPF